MPAYSYNSGVLRATIELASGIIPEHLIVSSGHFPGIPTIFRSPEIVPVALHLVDAALCPLAQVTLRMALADLEILRFNWHWLNLNLAWYRPKPGWH